MAAVRNSDKLLGLIGGRKEFLSQGDGHHTIFIAMALQERTMIIRNLGRRIEAIGHDAAG